MKFIAKQIAVAAACALALGSASAVGLVGLSDSNTLITFDSATPLSTTTTSITGLAAGERILSIDLRNPDNTIYGLSSLGNVYSLNASTGVAVSFASGVVPAVTAGISYEIDWNPNNNNLRVIGNGASPNSNRALTFATGVTAIQTALSRADGGPAVDVVGAAYASNFAGSPAATLSLYYIDAASDALFVNTNAFAGGVLTKVGDLTLGGAAFGVNNPSGFEITASGEAFVSWRENLYQIDLTSGALTVRGSIGPNLNVIGLTSVTAVPEPSTYALMVAGLMGVGWVARRRRAAR